MSQNPVTIFIAEDHVMVGDLLGIYISKMEGYKKVGHAKDGHTALAECQRLKPQLLILDIDMPGLNGLEVARRLGEADSEINILVFSSHSDAATMRRCMEVGVKGIVEKSASLTVMIQAIESVSGGRAFFGPEVTQILQRAFLAPVVTRTADQLTSREREVLQLVAEGKSNKEVASILSISLKTAENHRHNLMTKLDARNGADLTRAAFRLGLIRNNPTQG